RGLHLWLRTRDTGARSLRSDGQRFFPQPVFAMAGVRPKSIESRRGEERAGPFILLSQRFGEEEGEDPSIEEEVTGVRSKTELLPQGPIFSDPIAALRDAELPADFEAGRVYRIASEGSNVLTAVSRGLISMWNGPNHTLDYFLNGVRIGHRIFQINAVDKSLTAIDIRIEPLFQGKGLAKLITLYNLNLAHRHGLTYEMDVIINRNILASASKPFHRGERMFAPGALVQI